MNLLGIEQSSNILSPTTSISESRPIQTCDHKALLRKNYLSEYQTKSEKDKVKKNLGLNKEDIDWGSIGGFIQNQHDLYQILEQLKEKIETVDDIKIENILKLLNNKIDKDFPEGNQAVNQIKYQNPQYENIHTLEDALNFLLHTDISITLTCTPSVKEIGEVVSQIIYNWNYNTSIISYQKFDNEIISNDIRSITIEGEFTNNITKTLEVNDGYQTYTKSVSLNFYPGIYYGCLVQESIDSSSILQLTRLLQSTRKTTISVDASESGSFIFICIPYDYGVPEFIVNGFSGGFELIDDNFILNRYNTNSVRYRIYKSDNSNLGQTTITIQ